MKILILGEFRSSFLLNQRAFHPAVWMRSSRRRRRRESPASVMRKGPRLRGVIGRILDFKPTFFVPPVTVF